MDRKRMLNGFKAAAEVGPYDEFPVLVPGIDPQVYLTDCDPSALSPGQFVQAEIVASRGYDLVVRPAIS